MSKDKFLQIRLTDKKHQEFKDFCKEHNISMSKFIIDAISDKMKRMNTNTYNKDMMNHIKDLSNKLNGANSKLNEVKKQGNNTKALLEKQEGDLINHPDFPQTYEKLTENVSSIENLFRKKPKDQEVGYTMGKIVKKSGLPRSEVFLILRYSNKFERTEKGRWVQK